MQTTRSLALVALMAVMLTGCQRYDPAVPGASIEPSSKESNVSLTIEAAKAESVRIQNELIDQIPQEVKAAEKLPTPGVNPRTPMPCDSDGMHRYPGGSAVRVNEDADTAAIVATLRAHLRNQGWQEQSIPTDSQPDRIMQTNADGYEAIISSLKRSDDLPIISIQVWSPCATIPEDANPYAFKI